MASNRPRKICLDTVCILDALEKRPGFVDPITPVIKEAEDGKALIVVSSMAIAETLHISSRPNEDQLKIIEEFYDRPYVEPQAFDERIAWIAHMLRTQDKKVDAADAVHVATAIDTECEVLLTRDGEGKRNRTKMLDLDGIKVPKRPPQTGEYPPVRIMRPQAWIALQEAQAAPLFQRP